MYDVFALKVWLGPAKEQFSDVSIFSFTKYEYFQQVERTINFLDTLNQNLQEKIATYELYLITPSALFHPSTVDDITTDIAECIEMSDKNKPYNHFINHISATVAVVDRPRLMKLLEHCGISHINLLLPLINKRIFK